MTELSEKRLRRALKELLLRWVMLSKSFRKRFTTERCVIFWTAKPFKRSVIKDVRVNETGVT